MRLCERARSSPFNGSGLQRCVDEFARVLALVAANRLGSALSLAKPNRRRTRLTVASETPNLGRDRLAGQPLAPKHLDAFDNGLRCRPAEAMGLSSTIRARHTCFRGLFPEPITAASRSRSPGPSRTSMPFLIPINSHIRTSSNPWESFVSVYPLAHFIATAQGRAKTLETAKLSVECARVLKPCMPIIPRSSRLRARVRGFYYPSGRSVSCSSGPALAFMSGYEPICSDCCTQQHRAG